MVPAPESLTILNMCRRADAMSCGIIERYKPCSVLNWSSAPMNGVDVQVVESGTAGSRTLLAP